MICNLRNILSFCLLSLATVDASRRGLPRGTAPTRGTTSRVILVADASSSSSSESGDGLTYDEVKESRRVLEPFYGTVQDTLKAKGEHLLTLLAKADSLTLAEADIVAFEEASHQAVSRRLAVLRDELINIFKQKGTKLKTQTQADRVFKDKLTDNTLKQVVKEQKEQKEEQRKRKREDREEERGDRKKSRNSTWA
jgi:hypothetical protein